MKRIIGVRFKRLGKIYFFDPKWLEVKKGDKVTKDTVLFEIGSFNTNVAFQIIENGTYISPMSFVDIQG